MAAVPSLFSFADCRRHNTAPPPPMSRRSRSCCSHGAVEASGLLCPLLFSRQHRAAAKFTTTSAQSPLRFAATAHPPSPTPPSLNRCTAAVLHATTALVPNLALSALRSVLRRHRRRARRLSSPPIFFSHRRCDSPQPRLSIIAVDQPALPPQWCFGSRIQPSSHR